MTNFQQGCVAFFLVVFAVSFMVGVGTFLGSVV